MDSYQKYRKTLIITNLNESRTPVSDIPFPAVTICPDLKTNITEFPWNKEVLKPWETTDI